MIRYGAPLVSALEEAGMVPVVSQDFEEIEQREAEMGKNFSHPMMDPLRNDFVRGEAFWLFLEKEGRTKAGLAAKLVDLSAESIEAYLRRTSRGQYGREVDPIRSIDPMVSMVSGRCVYVGELLVVPQVHGNIKVLTRMARLMQLLALAEWDFHWMYGFVTDEHIKLNRLYGFSLVVRDALTWNSPTPVGRENTHALVGSMRRQLELLVRQEVGSHTQSK